MELDLIHDKTDPHSTGWRLALNGVFECYALGLPIDFEGVANVPDKTCCPYGRYEGIVRYSEHNKCDVIELLNVPGRTNIEIHIANYHKDILGCWGVGLKRAQDAVISSTAAFNDLMPKVKKALLTEKLWINVQPMPVPVEAPRIT